MIDRNFSYPMISTWCFLRVGQAPSTVRQGVSQGATYELRKSLIWDLSLSPVRMLTRSLPSLRIFVSVFRRCGARSKGPFVKFRLPVLHKEGGPSGVHRQMEEQRLTFISETGQTTSAFRITGPGAAYGFCPEKLYSIPAEALLEAHRLSRVQIRATDYEKVE